MNKNIFCALLLVASSSLLSNTESYKDVIAHLADRMYCIAELNGNKHNDIERELDNAFHKIKAMFAASADSENAILDRNEAFLLAAGVGNARIMNKFFNSGCNVNYTDKNGKTPLMIAALYGNIEVVTWLCEHGANVTAQDSDGFRAQYYASLGHTSGLHVLALLPQILIAAARYQKSNPFEECKRIIECYSR